MLFNHYTTELRRYFENLPENSDQSKPHRQVIESGRSKLFDFEYPIFDVAYKNVFETNFIRNFYMRQIGFETFGLFKFQLETWLLINMPYWNKMFESELLEYDPLTNVKTDSQSTKRHDKKQTEQRDSSNSSTMDSVSDNKVEQVADVEATTNRTVTNDTITTSNQTSENSETSQTDSTTNTNETSGGASNETDDNFNRQLESSNPDSRLELTASDGEGVIEYASSITENNTNNSKDMTFSNEKQSTDTANQNTTNTQNLNTDTTSNVNNDVIDDTDESSTTTVNTTDNSATNINRFENKNDTFSSTINDVEDFITHKFGKEGVQSFPKMVQEYRESLLRVEREIFREMNELFMMLY